MRTPSAKHYLDRAGRAGDTPLTRADHANHTNPTQEKTPEQLR